MATAGFYGFWGLEMGATVDRQTCFKKVVAVYTGMRCQVNLCGSIPRFAEFDHSEPVDSSGLRLIVIILFAVTCIKHTYLSTI